ncbi:DNA polymerase III subunit alpha [Scleromatobacter humisilvae]|uniref:Error-prone DNA polymerase n=1 Tax=Scleromatobacter humisilvae TaxID=2897159 RepID=A0A9X2C0Y9_9BURK|nr:DNA polymerase III subunit alpha [Scleromatobacter humisilvae]MCK9687001.1 DNA polymerase III subunit alpha [Scleromatobacter humisilvae]
MATLSAYAELHCRSNFSFLTGASSPEELVERAAALRYTALAVTDECSLSGVVHAYEQANELKFPLIVGAEMRLEPTVGGVPMRLVILATTRRGYGNLSQWISVARRRAEKGHYDARTGDLRGQVPTMPHLAGLPDCLVLLLPTAGPVPLGALEPGASSGTAGSSVRVGVHDGSPERRSGPSAGAAPVNAQLSGLSVIAAARASAAAAIASNSPGAGRPRGRETREARDGPSGDGPLEPPTPPKLAPPSKARRVARSLPPPRPSTVLSFESLFAQAQWLKTWIGEDRVWLAMPLLMQGDDDEIRERVKAVAAATGLRITAVGDVVMATRAAKPLQDVLTATRLRRTVSECGHALAPNAEAHLRSRSRLQTVCESEWLAETVAIAGRCKFSLGELKYEYPQEIVPAGETPTSWLRKLAEAGAAKRFPAGVPEKVQKLIESELGVIERLKYEAYFLTVADIVAWARANGILCQGRGSAANSAVCFCLGVTEVDPFVREVLFERFISEERGEPPDIDLDFEHQRREEVIQYLYRKYGRHRAALTGVIIRYRTKSAVRDVGRALGIDLDRIDAVTRSLHHVGGDAAPSSAAERLAMSLKEHGFDPDSRLGFQWMALSLQLRNQPRHLSQHPGGFVIAKDDVALYVPVENAAMDKRTVIQWDKDDLDVLKLLKVDILALGMLSALRRGLLFVDEKMRQVMPGPPPPEWFLEAKRQEQVEIRLRADGPSSGRSGNSGTRIRRTSNAFSSAGAAACMGIVAERVQLDSEASLQDIPAECKAVYDMLCTGDSVGVFQVESRAQMSMLPRLKPAEFYDLVVEVAIVRPGPIQGGMVHPYLKRREQKEPVTYPSDEAETALKRTLGVPIFQEQVMQLAILAADFTPGEADQLRRGMAAWKRKGGLEPFREKLISRMVAKNYDPEYAQAIFRQIQGFGEYGFPESHAVSFALLVYVSAWIKRHHPDAFLAALLNSLPMGFYAAPQLVRDARAHGVAVRPVDITISDWDSTLEPQAPHEAVPACAERAIPGGQCAVRLGLNRVSGIGEDEGRRIMAARAQAPFANVEDLARRAELDSHSMQCLAASDALSGLAGQRRDAIWAVAGVDTRATPMLKATRTVEDAEPEFESLSLGDAVLADYRALGLSLKGHPLALLRPALAPFKVQQAALLNAEYRPGQLARASGLVTHRQQPGTAKGVVFVTLEDETGSVNVIVWPAVAAAQRKPLLAASLLTVYGVWQREGEVRHLVAKTLVDHSPMLQGLVTRSRDFH